MSGGVKPFRAQAGSGLTDGGLAQLLAPAFAGEASAGDACADDFCADDGRVCTWCCCCCWGFPLHAASAMSEAAVAASATANLYLISRRYAGHGTAYRLSLVRSVM
jgi:hypothetical protein